jgi:hypothetical protein
LFCPADVLTLRDCREGRPLQSIRITWQAGTYIDLSSFALGACSTAEAWRSCFAARYIHLPQNIKYGVMSTSALLHDLWTWDDFFMAGRLHKPVLHFVRDHLVDRAVRANLDSALAAALLCLPANFTYQVGCITLPSHCRKAPLQNVRIRPSCQSDKALHHRQALMETICGLSYTGDIRMRWGEDRQKVQRIVQGSWSSLTHLFLPQLQV